MDFPFTFMTTSSPLPFAPRATSSLGHASNASVGSFKTANSHISPGLQSHHHSHSLSLAQSPTSPGGAFPFPPTPAGPAPSHSHTHSSSIHLGTITEIASSPAARRAAPDADPVQPTEELGAPTSGVYAQEGLWDDESDENDNDKGRSWRARLSGTTSIAPLVTSGDRRSVKSSKSGKSTAGSGGRSRSNTLTRQSVNSSSVDVTETGPWPWGRKASVSGGSAGLPPVAQQAAAVPALGTVPFPAPRTSMSAHRSSPSVGMASTASPATSPPLAPSATFAPQLALPSPAAAAAAASTSAPKLRQSKSRIRLLSKTRAEDDRPQSRVPLSPVNVNNLTTSPHVSISQVSTAAAGTGKPPPDALDGKNKSAWKRGMDRLWRSKSAGGLRESFHKAAAENPAPPVPALPRQHAHANHQHARLASTAGSVLWSPLSPQSPAMSSPSAGLPSGLSSAPGRAVSPRDDAGEAAAASPAMRTYTPLLGHGQVVDNSDDLDADPFAAYGVAPLPRPRRTSRSPIPDFTALPPVERPGIPRNMPSLTNLKSSLMPRLRKSKSMAMAKRPGSFFGANRDSLAAPLPSSPLNSPFAQSRALSPEPAAPRLHHLATEAAMGASPLVPPRPLFYDSFDLGDGADDDENEEDAGPTSRQRSSSVTSRNADESPHFLERVATRTTDSPRPSTSQSHAPGLDLFIDTDANAPSVSGSSAEALVTPSGTIATVTPGASSDSQTLAPSEQSGHSDDHDQRSDNPSFHDLYEQLGIWPTDQKASSSGTPRAHTPAGGQDRRSDCVTTPSLYDSASWEATISAFPTFDDPVVAATSLDYDIPDGQRESMASSNFAIVPTDSCSHSTAHDASPTKPQWSRLHGNGNGDREQVTGSGLWTSWRDVPRRGGGAGSNGSSRQSSRDRRPRVSSGPEAWLDGEDSEDESEDERDDVPLAKMHPEAAAAQQLKAANRQRRREARRAARDTQLRRAGTKSAKGLVPSRWNGEGGIPAEALAGRLEHVAVSEATPPSIPSRAPPRPPRPDRSLRDAAQSVSRATTIAGRSSTTQSVRSQSQMSGRVSSDGSDARHRVPSDAGRRIPSDGDAQRSHHSSHSSPVGSIAHRRPRAHSSASRSAVPTPPTTEPTPARRSTAVRCVVVSDNEPRAVTVDAFPETTARDVLASLRSRGDLKEGNWVVYESFAELGMERQVREFEVILSGVTRGWDGSTSANCLVLRETAPHTTFTRSIPETAPFVGGWVQHESKGKWNKRWLEVRGGQVFLSKNEKGKDELHVSTLFSDVYTIRKQIQAPQPYVFALKRLEPASSFEQKSEHAHYIATDDSTGYKLQSAVFVSRSFAMAQANPAIKAQRPSPVAVHTQAHVPQPTAPLQPRRPSQPLVGVQQAKGHGPQQPLLDLAAEPSPFTGRGLVRRI